MKTKAAILVKQKRPLVVDEVELPPLKRGQVLVKIHASGICGAQLGEIDGLKGPDRYLPHLLGHEAAAVVEETGKGVRHVKTGDHVVLHWRKGAGLEAGPAVYRWKRRQVNAGWVTTFQQRSVVSENRCTVIPRNIPWDIAALYGCCVTTGFGVVFKDAELSRGQSVLVLGVGGIGLAEVIAARLVGAKSIIAADVTDRKLRLAGQLGATVLIHSKKESLKRSVGKILGPGGPDCVLENTGIKAVIEEGYEICAAKGRTILVGVPDVSRKALINTLPLHFGKVLTGSYGGQTEPSKDIPEYLRLAKRRKIDFSRLISNRYPLERINEAMRNMRRGLEIRPVIVF